MRRGAGCAAPVRSRATMLAFPRALTAAVGALCLASSACGGSTSQGDTDAGGSSSSGGSGGSSSGGTAVDAGPDASPQADAGSGMLRVPLYSCLPALSYTAPVSLGSQPFQMILDTGSTTLAVAGGGCSTCSVTPLYTPGSTAADQHMPAMSAYGAGNVGWSGEIYQDSVAVGPEPATPLKFASISSQMSFFMQTKCDSSSGGYQGILGMGPGGAAIAGTTGFFDGFVATNKQPNVFAIQLCDTSGSLWLGGYDATAVTSPPQYTPMIAALSMYYYGVTLQSVAAGSTSAPVGSGQYTDSLVDTGTSAFLLDTTAFNTITAAIEASPAWTSAGFPSGFFPASASTGFSCANVSQTKAQLDAALPPLTLTFSGGATIQASPTESYLYSGGTGVWCPALVGNTPSAQFPIASIIGAPLMRSSVVIFDRAQQRVGFAPHKPCN